MIGKIWIVYLLFKGASGFGFYAAATGFQDFSGCEAVRKDFVKTFHPAQSACLSVDFRKEEDRKK